MTTDEMERMPHKKPDDSLAKIVTRFAPRISEFLTNADVLGEDVFADPELIASFREYRVAYEEALGEYFDTYHLEGELPEGATENDKFNARENFVRETTELNENEAITRFAERKHHGQSRADIDAHAMQLETHFGTLRNGYLREKEQATEQADSWAASLGPRKPRGIE